MIAGVNAVATDIDWQCATCRLAARAREGAYAIPNNPLIVAAVQAICAGGEEARERDNGWRSDKTGAPLYDFWSGSGARISVSVDAERDEAWSIVRSYSALSLDVAVAMLTGLASDPFRAATAAPRRSAVHLGAPVVSAAKGYKRFGAERLEFAKALESELANVMRLRFAIKDYPGFDPATRKWSNVGITRAGMTLFEPASEGEDAAHGACGCGAPLRFGAWCEHWLHAGGAMWVSPLPAAILQFDHRDNRGADALAKKIGVLLMLNWGAHRKSKELRVDARTLLRRVGELARPGVVGGARSGRLADRLEEALMRLSEAQILPNQFGNGEAAAMRADSRRWFETWLDAEIVFQRPAVLGESKRKAR